MGNERNIVLIGPFPDPVGGVSIHLQRLKAWGEKYGCSIIAIDESPKIKNDIFSIRSWNFIRYTKLIRQSDVVHVHSCIHVLRLFHILMCKLMRVEVIVTIHSWRSGKLCSFFFSHVLKSLKYVILVNHEINEKLQLKNYLCIPAFLPPVESNELLPKTICRFVANARERSWHVFSANAYKLVLHENQDLYGLDMCISMVDQLVKKVGIQVAFVFVVCCGTKGNSLYQTAKEKITELKLEKNFLLYNRSVNFIKLIKQSDIIFRPTNTDGDALTIREALYYGVPVIASNIVNRPKGVILFKNRDISDLVKYTMSTIEQLKIHKKVKSENMDSYIKTYMEIYNCN